ncbi:hypothetical protein [Sinomicrobium weinanense]|uniref:Serine protease n=1 Tax=Sinomicrobium weinanense TaxID=2842200 RepID=A0A926JTM1_9FLAO|nr:hypothetical protein [Sinomicrobium weinanense]MBC9797270.1 hypothetical protein [Sinomicrobium weinanense]MBU3122328.1 hypothetical protein [Sinomicrobium weinanense]
MKSVKLFFSILSAFFLTVTFLSLHNHYQENNIKFDVSQENMNNSLAVDKETMEKGSVGIVAVDKETMEKGSVGIVAVDKETMEKGSVGIVAVDKETMEKGTVG